MRKQFFEIEFEVSAHDILPLPGKT